MVFFTTGTVSETIIVLTMRSQTKPETKNTSLVILRLPDELKTKAQEVAAESGATLSELIRSLLKKKIGK